MDIELPENDVYIQGNKEALQRILFTLISNVICYGSDEKYLGIFLRTDKQRVKGQTIEKAFAENVFDCLFTMEDSNTPLLITQRCWTLSVQGYVGCSR